MFSSLFRGLHRAKCIACVGVVRFLSTQEVATALRPFYFIVHPDLFGQFPMERAVNEDSLKRLSEYVTSLQVSGRARPTELIFYVRQNSESAGQMKKVKVKLADKSLRQTVLSILGSCGLPVDYINNIPVSSAEASGKLLRSLQWHPSFYAATDRASPFQTPRANPQLMLRTWLQLNIGRSREKVDAIHHVQEDIIQLSAMLHDALNVQEIRWDSVWGITHFRGCLKSFYRLYAEHPRTISSILKGRRLIFSNKTGVSRLGEIVLSSEDVPTSWMRLLLSVGGYDSVLERLPFMEQKLSALLNGIGIIRQERSHSRVMAEDYELLLNKLLNSLRRCQDYVSKVFEDTDLSGFEMVVDGENAPMTLTSTGSFLIPASMPGTMVIDYIHTHKAEAYTVLRDIHSSLRKEAECVEKCALALELLEISKDENVTPQQMISCCERLTSEYWRLCVSLHQSRIQVSHYYSVMQDGKICIPWDWIGDDS
ncbi:T-cell activation inhibitor, mitochondrial-like [Littorina saxatilis]|uniref:T-cell activation inhibitor, mitochondrial n=1 Tax=Littorina saxatilis TaxID=31220 RepID=A0AAN9C0K1_9CAEN